MCSDCEEMKKIVLRNAEDAYSMNKALTSQFDRTVQSPTREKSKVTFCAISHLGKYLLEKREGVVVSAEKHQSEWFSKSISS